MNKFLILLASLAIASASERKEITLVEYWADWNKCNEVTYLDSLNNVKVLRVDIMAAENMDVLINHNIVVLPTLIFFIEGEEVKRIEGDVSFTIDLKRGEVQKIIDELSIGPKK